MLIKFVASVMVPASLALASDQTTDERDALHPLTSALFTTDTGEIITSTVGPDAVMEMMFDTAAKHISLNRPTMAYQAED